MQPQQPQTTPPVHLLQADVDRVTMSKAMPPPAALDKARFLTRFAIAPWRRRSDDDGTSIDVEAEQAVPSSGSVGQEPTAVASSLSLVKQEPKAAAFISILLQRLCRPPVRAIRLSPPSILNMRPMRTIKDWTGQTSLLCTLLTIWVSCCTPS